MFSIYAFILQLIDQVTSPLKAARKFLVCV
jgi:hypothetical protein